MLLGRWIPAPAFAGGTLAGMTNIIEKEDVWIPAFAGMTLVKQGFTGLAEKGVGITESRGRRWVFGKIKELS